MITTAKSLRFHTKEILETTMRGEEVIVTYRGKPAVRIIPFSKVNKNTGKNSTHRLFGLWKDVPSTEDVPAYIRKIRKGRSF